MSSFVLKIIAIIFMSIDHIGDAIIGSLSGFNFLGRIAFPIFAFQCSEGAKHTHDPKKHILKLLIFAFISQIPFLLFLSTFTTSKYLNIFFTLFLGSLSIYLYEKYNHKFVGIILAILLSILGELLQVDYGAFGILLIFFFYLFRNNRAIQLAVAALLIFLKYINEIIKAPSIAIFQIGLMLCTMLSLVFLAFYNGKQGKKSKYFFYIFYPAHLLVLYFLHGIII